MSIILSTAYHAPIQYYAKFMMGQPIIIEQNDTYTKQSYRNRCLINSADGALALSVPVSYSSSEKTKTKDVVISQHGNWQHMHWNAIVSAYNPTPFFEYYRDDYEKFYTNTYSSLLEFNDQLLRLTLDNLNIKAPEIVYSDSYIDGKDMLDYRELIHPKRSIQEDSEFQLKTYYQVFQEKHGFVPNLSILDLLFNMGNESILILKKSINQ